MSRHGQSKNLASVIPDDLREIRDRGTNERDILGRTDGHCRTGPGSPLRFRRDDKRTYSALVQDLAAASSE
ncbi:hypothetical protein [Roseibium sp. MMSF_3544]|uniref:hypothetical protein n=1 Tax=unclassified Roseibium TaxID=2629323 RepID=UPI00273FD7EF|nr:hypothetical protein [Roseibium sp. MMSF_3544]